MSPRSQEFVTESRGRLTGARRALAGGDHAIAASAAYYAMLYVARAALSERDLYAKTHSGVWSLFSRTFVAAGTLDPELSAMASEAQNARELGDYEARPPSEADALVGDAERFVEAVAAVL